MSPLSLKLPAFSATFRWMVALLVLAEVAAALLLPLFVSDERYLDWYLPEASEASTVRFLAGDHLLREDPAAGWRSAPNQSEATWVTDAMGARSTGRGRWEAEGVRRILALGSSMVNGGTGVTNQETITAYLESEGTVALNFGTMLYGPDQSLLRFESDLSGLGADVVIVGLDADPYGALSSVYLPFRRPDETNMPLVKPRFTLQGSALELVEVEPRVLLDRDRRGELLAVALDADGYADRFRRFVRMGQTPLLRGLGWGLEKVENRLGPGTSPSEEALLDAVLQRLDDAIRQTGAQPIFLAMPPERDGFYGALPEHDRRVAHWRSARLTVVDGAEAFLDSQEPLSALYGDDGIHFTPLGNRLLAAAIARAFE